jgi:hypothetical protein
LDGEGTANVSNKHESVSTEFEKEDGKLSALKLGTDNGNGNQTENGEAG